MSELLHPVERAELAARLGSAAAGRASRVLAVADRVTADMVVLAARRGHRYVLLIERGKEPYVGSWALPGGHLEAGEPARAAAVRELVEETGVRVGSPRLVGVYGRPGRDPRGRYVSVAYTITLPALAAVWAGDDASVAHWLPLRTLDRDRLAFDHGQILTDALSLPPEPLR